MKTQKKIPKFNTEKEESEFWQNTDSTEYINWDNAMIAQMPDLQKTTKNISITLPIDLIEKLKIQANKINVPYHSLIKLYLSRQLFREAR